MKYFLCTFEAVYLGIPSECTKRIISVPGAAPLAPAEVSGTQPAAAENENNDIFISLPFLFGRADLPAPHGIVLKPADEGKKIILLAPPLDIVLEIPDEDIYTIPRALGGKLPYVKGACFIKKDQKERLVFTLDMEKLLEEYSCKTR